jgi:deoxyribodipyrimidine photo-lyase
VTVARQLTLRHDDDAVEIVRRHLGHLVCDPAAAASPLFPGGQTAADQALSGFRVGGYARRRSNVWPDEARGASRLSPYIRHGLLQLGRVWDAVGDGPAADVGKFRDELLWQEYARHLYARVGSRTAQPLRSLPATGSWTYSQEPLPTDMACLDHVATELTETGWLVNQTRMWVASQWTVRSGHDWRAGEDWMFRHLLDGSRAANRLGWQWTIGAGTGQPYGFSRWQVERRAPSWCASCALAAACPIEAWPTTGSAVTIDGPAEIRHLPSDAEALERVAGPTSPAGDGQPDAVWITAESLGDADPALAAWPDLPVIFVFDEPLLERLQLSTKRLVFLTECLVDLAVRRNVTAVIGDPAEVLSGRSLATTFAPVPGWRRVSAAAAQLRIHPWPWLVQPTTGTVASFSAWARATRAPVAPRNAKR